MKVDVIAQGIINAAETVKLSVPVVVRLEGTNVEKGKQLVKKSGVELIPADNLADAAQKVVKAAGATGSKTQIPRKIQNPNNERTCQNPPRRDLEDRTLQFASGRPELCEKPAAKPQQYEDVRQLVRASGSVAANWMRLMRLSVKRIFLMRVKICRKEAKETRLFVYDWLILVRIRRTE